MELWLLGLISIGGYAYLEYLSRKNKNVTKDKSQGFATLSNLKSLTGSGGFQVSKNIKINEKTMYEHLIIFGPTGSGKTTSQFYPNLLQKDSFCGGTASIVVTDPKGELYRDTADFQRSLGRETLIFAPLEPHYSIKYNPLDFCINESEVISLARDVLIAGVSAINLKQGTNSGGSAEWINMSVPLLASSMIYVWSQGKPYNTISNALKTVIDCSAEELEQLLGYNSNIHVSNQYKLFKTAGGSERTISSIQVTLSSNLQIYLDPQIQTITEQSDFNFKDFRRKPIILYINYPVEKSADIAPLLSIFFGQMISRCKEIEKGTPMFFLYDEFANIGKIPDFAVHASTLRSYRMSLICCLQDKNQLKSVYGNHADTIYNNLKNMVVYGGLKDDNTITTISKLCGKTEVNTESYSKSQNSNHATTSTGKREIDVMSYSDVKDIDEDSILVMLKNSKPIIDTQNKFYTQTKYKSNIRKSEKTVR